MSHEIKDVDCNKDDKDIIEGGSVDEDNSECQAAFEDNPGRQIQRDIDEGESIKITCSTGCLNITKAMFSCVADSGVMVPAHIDLLKSKCDGREECVTEACDRFWGTNLRCASFDKAQLWVHYRYSLRVINILIKYFI